MAKEVLIFIGILVAAVAFGLLVHFLDKPKTQHSQVTQIQVGGNLSVERVPVFGKYVTCVIDKETDSFGNPRHSISCDWVGYHSK